MKYIHPTEETGTQEIQVCRDQHAISVFVNHGGTITIQSTDSVDGQTSVWIIVDPIHVDRLIAALAQIKKEF
jgi:hypothetical protein